MSKDKEPTNERVAEVATKIDAVLEDRGILMPRLREYFAPGESGRWAGGYFERLDPTAHTPNRIGCHDLVAVTFMDVAVPPLATKEMLLNSDVRREITTRLEEIPDDKPLWEATDDDLRAANGLWDYFGNHESFKGMGAKSDTIRSKVMARKRPHLIPITDKVVRGYLRRGDKWKELRAVLSERDDIRTDLEQIRNEVAPHVSVLRILDAAIWVLHSKQWARTMPGK